MSSNVIKGGLDWLERKLKNFCSSPVEYHRNDQSYHVDAIIGKTDYHIEDDHGIKIATFVWDFLIDAEELGLEPKVGDIIIYDGSEFEVMNLADGPCWRWSSPVRKTYRIHTKLVCSN